MKPWIMQWFSPGRRWVGWGSLVLLLVVGIGIGMVACQSETTTAKPQPEGPWELAIKYENARLQGDDQTQYDLITPEDQKTADLDVNQELVNPGRKVPDDYRLVEYKAHDELYYYYLQYRHPTMGHEVNSFFKVQRIKEGNEWRMTYGFDRPAFEYETQDLEGRLVKGVHDQP